MYPTYYNIYSKGCLILSAIISTFYSCYISIYPYDIPMMPTLFAVAVASKLHLARCKEPLAEWTQVLCLVVGGHLGDTLRASWPPRVKAKKSGAFIAFIVDSCS